MASNLTARFKLNQWAADDQVLREDFNRDNSILEEALTKLVFTTGIYTGTGSANGITQSISLGFVPEVVMVFAAEGATHPIPVIVTQSAKTTGTFLTLGTTSFTVRSYFNGTASENYCNKANPYRYIAWRKL